MIIERRQNHRVSLALPVRYKIFHLDQIENEIQEESFRLSSFYKGREACARIYAELADTT